MPYSDRTARRGEYSPSSSSGAATPTTPSASSSTFLSNPMSGIASGFGGLVRRFSDMTTAQPGHHIPQSSTSSSSYYSHGGSNSPLSYPHNHHSSSNNNGISGVYTPPINRSASPMRPPPLEPLELSGFREDTSERARLLTPAVAEEIRIMVPERQRIEDQWNLVYSLDQDGASLGTLYKKCSTYEGTRSSFVLVVKDNDGGLFGAYLSDPPHPSAHYFGNGECFLWRASVLTALPPPPSVDTTNATRATTITSPTQTRFPRSSAVPAPAPPPKPEPAEEEEELLIDLSDDPSSQPPLQPQAQPEPAPAPAPAPPSSLLLEPIQSLQPTPTASRSPSPCMSPSIRFKAFPYSGENDFNMYCEHHTLSIGGGDGRYGLWLNDSLDKGVSSRCLTFGNEPLSDEGEKFGVLGVEVWLIGRGGRR